MTGKPATLKEIAHRLNISISTASRALNNEKGIGLGTRNRVKALAQELNYEPNQTAICFQQGRTFTIGVIVPELSEAFFSKSISGIEDVAEKNNYSVLIAQSHDNKEREKKIIETMKKNRVDGLIVSISKSTDNYDHFEILGKYNIPIVFFDRIPKMPNIHSVTCNMEAGTIQAINFILKRGHRVVGMINGPKYLIASEERLKGYMAALSKKRLKFDPSIIVSTDLTIEGTHYAMRELLSSKRKITAIVTFNDYVALDAVKFAQQNNLRINKDISFISYANLPISNYSAFPPLASVEQFPYEQGKKAVETLLELLVKTKVEARDKTFYKSVIDSKLVIHA
jgi:LacI family repressor for deo operon, udp, cdd, tsx, nupC, and nupG